MADDHPIPQYPFMFSPDQFQNTYSPYAKKALPFMGLYDGGATGPTDAHGNPIQSYQTAQAAYDAWNAANPAPPPQQAPAVSINSNPYGSMFGGLSGASPGGPDTQAQYAYNQGLGGVNPASAQGRAIAAGQQTGPGGAAAAAKPAAATNPIDMNAAYMAALSNPGHVSTPGATVPQAAPPSNQSGVLQQFLANWKPGANPAGNYNPNLFPDALRGQV